MTAADKKINSICETAYEEVNNLIEDFHRFYVVLYDSSNSSVTYPLVMNDGQCLQYNSRYIEEKFLPDHSIVSRTTIKADPAISKEEGHFGAFRSWPENEEPPVSIVCSPMLAGDKVFGALVVEKRNGKKGLTNRSVRILDEIAQQTAVSIEKVYLYEGLEEKVKDRTKRLQAVHNIGVKLSENVRLGEKKILELIKEIAGDVMNTDNMYIALYETDTKDFFDPDQPGNSEIYGTIRFGLMYVNGKEREQESRKAELGRYGRTEAIIATREPILNKTREESEAWYHLPGHDYFPYKDEEENKSYAAWLGVPMISGGKVIGVISTYHEKKEYLYDKEDQKVLEMMASQVAAAIENAWLYKNLEGLNQNLEEKVQDRTKRIEAVHNIGVKLSENVQLGEKKILELIKEYAGEVMNTDNMYIALYEPDPKDFFDSDQPGNSGVYGTIRFGLMYVDGNEREQQSRRAKRGKYGRTEVIIANREPILNKTREESEAWYHLPGHANFLPADEPDKKESFAAWLGVPMISGGKVIGVISTYHEKKEYLYDKEDQKVLEMMASQVAAAIENSWLYSQMNEKVKIQAKQLYDSQILAESLAAFNSVAGELAHKMNNLAGTIPARVRLIKEIVDDRNPKKQKINKLLDGILFDSNRLLEEADRIRKSTDPDESISTENLNKLLNLAFEQVKNFFPDIFSAKKIDYVEEYTPEQLIISVPKVSFEIALFNIIRNAVEALTEGGKLQLRSELISKNKAVLLISDTGYGIEKATLPHIFDPFYTTKKTGMGFGLWQAKIIVNKVGGHIEVESERDKGTTFKINLPIL